MSAANFEFYDLSEIVKEMIYEKTKEAEWTAAGVPKGISFGHSSTGVSPRPMLMGAPRNALRAFNAGVSLSCLHFIARKLPCLLSGFVWIARFLRRSWRTCRPARYKQIVSICFILPHMAGLSFSRFLRQNAVPSEQGKGEKLAPSEG